MEAFGEIEPMIHISVPLSHLQMSPTPEPEAEYSDANIKRWYLKLVLTSRPQEAAMILRLAFTRPRLLYEVMKMRKAISKSQRRQATLATQRRYMATQRAAQQAAGVLPRRRPKAKAKARAHAMPVLAIADGIM